MLYSIDDYKNLTPSQIVMGKAEDFLTWQSNTGLSVNFNDGDGSISPNVLYILSFRCYTDEVFITSKGFIQVIYTFRRNVRQFSGEMIITDATLVTVEPIYTWFSGASNSYDSGTNITRLSVAKNLYNNQGNRCEEGNYSGLLFLRLF